MDWVPDTLQLHVLWVLNACGYSPLALLPD